MTRKILLLLSLVSILTLLTVCASAETQATPPPQEETRERIHSDKWYAGHEYKNWIADQNAISDDNSNLDGKIEFVSEGRVRKHPERVYFYDNIDAATYLAADTRLPIAFWVFSEECRDCLFDLVDWGQDPQIVERSWDFINVYVDMQRDDNQMLDLRMMTASRSVQFYLPGLRRIRVVEVRSNEELIEVFDLARKYVDTLTDEELLKPPQPLKPVWDKKIRKRRGDKDLDTSKPKKK